MKSKYLFDTGVLIDYLRGLPQAENLVKKALNNHDCYISSITIAELHSGSKTNEEALVINNFLNLFQVINIDHKIAETGGKLKKLYNKSHGLGLADAIIAAAAQSIEAEPITLNTKHFPMFKGLKKLYSKK